MACYANGLFGFLSSSASLLPVLESVAASRSPTAAVWDGSMDISSLTSLYKAGILTPEVVIEEVYRRIALPKADQAVWLHLLAKEEVLKAARELSVTFPDPENRPALFGIPYSIKDSIDFKGTPTTGACPQYAFIAEEDAPTVVQLRNAGALAIGKVNLGQSCFNPWPLFIYD